MAYPDGVEPKPQPRDGIEVISYDALFGDQTVQWTQLNALIEKAASETRGFEVPVAATFALADAVAAHQRVAAGRVPGKVVLRIP